MPAHDTYRCPAGEALTFRYTKMEAGLTVSRYWTSACPKCPIKANCTPAPERRVTRWEHEHTPEAMQQRLDENPNAMRVRWQVVEHPFGTLKARMGASHFLMKTMPRVSTETALHILAYYLARMLTLSGSGRC